MSLLSLSTSVMRERRIGPRPSSSKQHRGEGDDNDDDDDDDDDDEDDDDDDDNDDDNNDDGFDSRRRAVVMGFDDLFLFFSAPSTSPCPCTCARPTPSSCDKASCSKSHRSTNRNVTAGVERWFLAILVDAHCNDPLSISILSIKTCDVM